MWEGFLGWHSSTFSLFIWHTHTMHYTITTTTLLHPILPQTCLC